MVSTEKFYKQKHLIFSKLDSFIDVDEILHSYLNWGGGAVSFLFDHSLTCLP